MSLLRDRSIGGDACAQPNSQDWIELLSAFGHDGQTGRFQASRKRTIEAMIYVLEQDVPWSGLCTDARTAHAFYRNCLRWMSSGALDHVLIKLVELGYTDTWCDASRRYGNQLFDCTGVRKPGVIHIVTLRQAHLYRQVLAAGGLLRGDEPLRRVFRNWWI